MQTLLSGLFRSPTVSQTAATAITPAGIPGDPCIDPDRATAQPGDPCLYGDSAVTQPGDPCLDLDRAVAQPTDLCLYADGALTLPGDPCQPEALAAPGDPCVPLAGAAAAVARSSEAAALNAALIASLPQSGLDALMRETQPAPAEQSFANLAINLFPASPVLRPAWLDTVVGGTQYGGELVQPPSLKQAALGGARAPDPHFEIGPTAVTRDLVNRARQSGLSSAEVAQLEAILRNSSHFETDARLVADLLGTENAARGLRTFMDLDPIRRQNPGRITPDIVAALALGVGRARTDASEGREGILGNQAAVNAAKALVEMRSADYTIVADALNHAAGGGSPIAGLGADGQTERALILKAVAARREHMNSYTAFADKLGVPSKAGNEIKLFANQIRNVNAHVLIEHTSGIDLDGDGVDEALQQKWQNASAPAVLQMARAEVDPVYAWTLHNDALHGTAPTGLAANEQKKLVALLGGVPTARDGDTPHGDDMVFPAMYGAVSEATGLEYQREVLKDTYASRAAAADHIEQLVRSGVDVPIAVTSNAGDGRAMLVTDVRGSGASRQFLVTDPWTGRTDWVARSDITDGNLGGAGGALTDYWW